MTDGEFACATTWSATWRAIAPFAEAGGLAQERQEPERALEAAREVAPWTPWAPDAVLNTARHMFFQARCGIFVAVAHDGVAAFVPFANAKYQNWWWRRVRLRTPSGREVATVAEYASAKAFTLRTAVEPMLPLRHWWLNGGIACNVLPADGSVWGTSFCADLKGMLQAAGAAARAGGTPFPPVCFFLNKRDYPVLRRDRRDPYARFVGDPRPEDIVQESYVAHAPVFSFYTGAEVADVAMPTTDDWRAAQQSEEWAALREAHPLSSKRAVAVFRGTATSEARVHLANRGQCSPVLDVGITGWNSGRDRVDLVPGADGAAEDPVIVVTYTDPCKRPRARFMSMHDQATQHRYIVYCDGHCAAGRYGTLMHTGSLILRVPSLQMADCGDMWVFQHWATRGAKPGDAPEVWADADHVALASPTGEDLDECVRWLNEQPLELLQRVINNAVARAPTVARITEFWAAWVHKLHAAGQAFAAPAGGACKVWWTPRETQYANISLA